MSWVATAIAGSAVVGALASDRASSKQANAAGNAAATTMQQYKQTRGDLMPWQTTGRAANATLANYLGINSAPTTGPDWAQYLRDNPDVAASATYANDPAQHYEDYGRHEGRTVKQVTGAQPPHDANFGSLLKPFTGADLASEPGYQFGIQQGEQGINRMAMAGSGRNNGATMKALLRYNEDYAGTKFGDAFNRDSTNKSRTFGFLSGVSGQGENAAAQTGGLGANAAGNAGNVLTQGADASAAGTVGMANAVSGGVGNYLNYQNNQSMMDYLRNLRGGIANTGASAPFGARM